MLNGKQKKEKNLVVFDNFQKMELHFWEIVEVENVFEAGKP